MTPPQNTTLARPVTCQCKEPRHKHGTDEKGKPCPCGEKFIRKVRQQRRCDKCMSLRIKLARMKSGGRPPETWMGSPVESAGPVPSFAEQKRTWAADTRKLNQLAARELDSLSLRELLGSPCGHGTALGDCPESWCRNRVADLGVTEVKRVIEEEIPVEEGETFTRTTTVVSYRSARYNARPVLHPSVIEQAPAG